MANRFSPIADLGSSLQEQGRIRLGVKDAKRGMRSIDTFRFTSPDRSVIEVLAGLYGGTARPWNESSATDKNQFEVITEANEISVWIGSQGMTQHYEYWIRAGCIRRCDGIACQMSSGEQYTSVPCVCNSEQPPSAGDQCKPKTRMTVIIPEVRMAGGWRIETSSWNAAKEMPQMEQLLRSMESAGLARAKLIIKHGMSKGGGTTKRFTYPQLILDETPHAIMAGAANVHQRTRVDVESREARPAGPVDLGADMMPTTNEFGEPIEADDIEDAEIVEDEPAGWATLQEAKASGQGFKKNRGEGPNYVPVS